MLGVRVPPGLPARVYEQLASGCLDEQLVIRLLVWRLHGYESPVKESDGEEIKDTASEGICRTRSPQGAGAEGRAAAKANKNAEADAAATEAPKKRFFKKAEKSDAAVTAASRRRPLRKPSRRRSRRLLRRSLRRSVVSGFSRTFARSSSASRGRPSRTSCAGASSW